MAIGVKQNTAYRLEVMESPLTKKENVHSDYTVVDHYSDLIESKSSELEDLSTILVVDDYFAKYKFVQSISEFTALRIASGLRDDSNLKYLHQGLRSSARRRPRKLDGKVDTKNIDKRRFGKVCQDDEIIIYDAVVYKVSLKRKINVAYVEFLDEKAKNTCLTTGSLGKVLSRNEMGKDQQISHSIFYVKTKLRTRKMIKRILSMFGFD